MKSTTRRLLTALVVLVLIAGAGFGIYKHHIGKNNDLAVLRAQAVDENNSYDKSLNATELNYLNLMQPYIAASDVPQHYRWIHAAQTTCSRLDEARNTADVSSFQTFGLAPFPVAHYAIAKLPHDKFGNEAMTVVKYMCPQNIGIVNRVQNMISPGNYIITTKPIVDDVQNSIVPATWQTGRNVTGCVVDVLSPTGQVVHHYGSNHFASAGFSISLTTADAGRSLEVSTGCNYLVPDKPLN